MKLSVPHKAVGRVLHALHCAEADSLLLQRTGPGWIIELPRHPGSLRNETLTALGATLLDTKNATS